MSPDPSKRFQEYMEFRGSAWYPGLISLFTCSSPDAGNSTEVAFSLPDLYALRQLIDQVIGPGACSACAGDRHEDCPQHHGIQESCGCDQRTLHKKIFNGQVALYRASRRR